MSNIKQGYKQTDIGVIPEDWDIRPIGEVLKVTTGNKNTQDKKDDGIYPFFVRSQTVERINTYTFDGEGVLTAGDGVGTGKVFHYINGKFDYHQRVYLMHGFDDKVLGKYFFWFFSKYFYERINQLTAKSSVDSVRREMIADMLMPLPKKEEQTAIATALSDTDALIAALDKKIAKKQQIKQGAMQQLLTGKKRLPGFSGEWVKKKLGEVCLKFATGKKDANAMNKNGKYRFYTCAKDFSLIDTYSFDDEVLLISGNGANVGYIHYYNGKFDAYQRTYVLSDFNIDVLFLKYLLDIFLPIRIDDEKNDSNTPFIKMNTLTDMILFTPKNQTEQTAIAQILTDMDNEITQLEKERDKYKEIKAGMMQVLLTGKVRFL